MKISTGQLTLDRYARLAAWHSWFAFLPVTLVDGDTVWLERIERRLEGGEQKWDDDGLIRCWEYRKPETPG